MADAGLEMLCRMIVLRWLFSLDRVLLRMPRLRETISITGMGMGMQLGMGLGMEQLLSSLARNSSQDLAPAMQIVRLDAVDSILGSVGVLLWLWREMEVVGLGMRCRMMMRRRGLGDRGLGRGGLRCGVVR